MKLFSILKGSGFSILFVLLGIYILKTNETLLGNIIGITCIVFFGILMLWGIFKMTKKSKIKKQVLRIKIKYDFSLFAESKTKLKNKSMNTKINWVVEGLIFGIIMLIFSSILDLISDDFTFDRFWIKILIWLIGGLVYGLLMKLLRDRKATK